ncbi:transcription elongation factor B polypeptide 3 isoform X2 [Achroia grisella]|uniref:transcription elongation factor B polypeptide 3 isoform X2 n=1 Tax=Achroia grisella TaxID=688607 RepID=UPI0027D270FE|nr:transcription elongation factor B polypeptide 3 isoform X2 [Achroia grisella]
MATVLDLVKHYQHAIEKYPEDEQKILKCIDKLFNLDVTVQHLQETGVGRTVNALRKHPDDVGKASRALIYKWKCMVAAEESDQEMDQNNDTSSYNGHGNNGRDTVTKHLKTEEHRQEKNNYSNRTDDHKHNKEVNGNYSGIKRKYQSSEDEDHEIKKTKNTTYNGNEHIYNRKTNVKIKSEPRSESDHNSDHSNTDETDSDVSQSSEEDVKVKKEIKTESKNYDKLSSRQSHSKHTNDKKSSTKSYDSEQQSRHKNKCDSRKSSSQEKSHSHKQKSTHEKESSSAKKHKPDSNILEKDKKQRDEIKSSNKHSSSSGKQRSSTQSNDSRSEKHKSHNDKQSSKSEKHGSSSQSHKSEKDKHKSSTEKETSSKHKIKDSSSSSSSKEKHSSSSKEKSKDRSSSSKEKSDNKNEKKLSSESKSKSSESKNKHEKLKASGSSSSHKSSKTSNSKSKEDIPKKKSQANNSEDSEDGIDCGSGASFAEALGMLSPAKPKKKSTVVKEIQSPNSNDLSPAALLAPSAKLAPLPTPEISGLPEISPNYKPRPPPKLLPHFTDDEAMSAVISSKNQRTKVYSGNKVIGKIPTLYEMCVQLLQEHIDALEYTGGVPYELLKPVVDRASPQQLFVLEHYNPYLMEDTDHLWQKFCEKHFRKQQRHEMETWREMYIRCQEEQEYKLKNLTANIKIAQEAKKAPIKQTKMAYVDTIVKPPRNVARKQKRRRKQKRQTWIFYSRKCKQI